MDFNYISENDDKLHRDMNEEALFFRQAANGDIPAIRKNLAEKRFRNQSGMGKLSDDPVLNLKYHMVITAGILARVCINRGLEIEQALSLSDFYIKKLDNAKTENDVEKIHSCMVIDFTGRMNALLYKARLSRPVSMCLDYIYAHIGDRITVKQLVDYTGVSSSFLSKAFLSETGLTISNYIRKKKIEMAKDMLTYSDMNISDIAYRLSFSSQSHFIQTFNNLTGITPKKYRDNLKNKEREAFSSDNEIESYPSFYK